MLENYLVELFGNNNVTKINNTNDNEEKLPLYLRSYSYSFYSVYHISFLVVYSSSDIHLKTYLKQKAIIESFFNLPSALLLDHTNYSKRRSLIENNISFIEIGKQVYLPFIGIALQNRKKFNTNKEKTVSIPFTHQTSLVALFFVYNNTSNVSVSDIEAKTHLNTMAISRALKCLEMNNLVRAVVTGTKKIYSLSIKKEEYIDYLLNHLLNPVIKEVLIKKDDLNASYFNAGESALSFYSSLASTKVTYAISNNDYKKIASKTIEYDEALIYDDSLLHVQVWKEDLTVYGKDGCVDILSLLLTLNHTNQDERIEEAINKCIRRLKNE